MKRSVTIAIISVLVIVIVSGTLIYQNITPAPTLESVTIGHVPMESFTLLYIAQNQHYFEQNNLNVTIKDYVTGPIAVNALTDSEVEVAGSSEYVVALNAVEKQNISIIAAVGDSEMMDLIARTDREITNASDLSGKTIGVALKTVAEFNLGKFLESNGLSMGDVSIVNVVPAQFKDSIVNGSVDAVVSWEPYTDQILMELQSGYTSWSLNADTTAYSVLSCRNDWITTHTDTLNRLIESLLEAQNFVESHPAEAQQIIKDHFNYTDSYLTTVWNRNNFRLSLTQTMTDAMQEEANWLISNNLTTQKTEPTIRNFIVIDFLKQLKSDVVEIQ